MRGKVENKDAWWHKYNCRPISQYRAHRAAAALRDIPFNLTFDAWWGLWEPYWDRRGCGNDDYVMARIGDSGPYAPGNVRIVTGLENRLEMVPARGSETGKSDITEEDIPDIRAALRAGIPQKIIGKWYGVSQPAIGYIARGKHWRHVP